MYLVSYIHPSESKKAAMHHDNILVVYVIYDTPMSYL